MFFFFNDTATTEIYTLSLHDALPISARGGQGERIPRCAARGVPGRQMMNRRRFIRSEEHTSELQSQFHLVCRLLLEKKKPPRPPALASRRALPTAVPPHPHGAPARQP